MCQQNNRSVKGKANVTSREASSLKLLQLLTPKPSSVLIELSPNTCITF